MLILRHYAFDNPFEYPFTIAKGTKTHQPAFIVMLGLGRLAGWGEAPVISYYPETLEGMQAAVEKGRGVIERYALTDPKRFWHFLHHLLPGQHFLTAALDIAGWDLFAQLRRAPLRLLLGISGVNKVTNYTLGHDSIGVLIEKVRRHPWPVYKVKFTSADDLDLLVKLRAHTNAAFRVDANESLNYDDTLRLLPELKKLDVELLEQPLPRTAVEEMKALKPQSPLPLIADESCQTERDVAACADAFHGINIKLTKCGGITPALNMIADARKLGLQLMLGNMNETSIGTAAIVQLSPLADWLDADGPLLLAKDGAEGLSYGNDGMVQVSEAPGMGVRVRF